MQWKMNIEYSIWNGGLEIMIYYKYVLNSKYLWGFGPDNAYIRYKWRCSGFPGGDAE